MNYQKNISKEKALKEITKYLDEYSHNGEIRAYTLESIKYELRCNKNAMGSETSDDVVILDVNGQHVEVPENIGDLIECLMICDIVVIYALIKEPPEDYIRIDFLFQSGVDKFTEILFKGKDKNSDIAKRAIESSKFERDAWDWTARAYEYEKEGTDIISNVDVEISVSFPKRDYEWILKKFKKYLAKHNLKSPTH